MSLASMKYGGVTLRVRGRGKASKPECVVFDLCCFFFFNREGFVMVWGSTGHRNCGITFLW